MKRLLWLMHLSFALALSPAPAYSLNDAAAGGMRIVGIARAGCGVVERASRRGAERQRK